MQEILERFSETIRNAGQRGGALRITGSGSKDFYGEAPRGEVLNTAAYTGIVEYEPKELVLTARAGTPLAEIEEVLQQAGQMLPFEPPHFGPRATLGGCVATGLSGPRRAYLGSVRDFVLGTRIMDGHGDDLRFGGQVMKNVAGYDVARLMAGAMGTLGLILEVSLKVLPRPAKELTLRFEMPEGKAIETMNRWAGEPLPLSATCFTESILTIRLSGAGSAVEAARARLGGEVVEKADEFWRDLREHKKAFFNTDLPLWRLSLPSTHEPLHLPGRQMIEWGGALRWVIAESHGDAVREVAGKAHGHATLFRSRSKEGGVFRPLAAPLLKIHRRLKQTFDPHGVFNPGRMYADF